MNIYSIVIYYSFNMVYTGFPCQIKCAEKRTGSQLAKGFDQKWAWGVIFMTFRKIDRAKPGRNDV